jgi:segregation and condensation protein A
MNNVYKLKIFDFEGPIEKLVELIEDKKLEINELSLAQITADFLNYLESLTSEIQSEENKKEYLQILSSFVVMASRLIFIKSKSLLNFNLEKDEEEEKEIKDLEIRLRWFQEFRPALKIIKNLWLKNIIFSRSYLEKKFIFSQIFAPGNLKDVSFAPEYLNKIFGEFEKLLKEEKTLAKNIISLEEKIKSLLAHFKLIQETNFSKLSENLSRGELIVTFLAILHLAREGLILLEQNSHFSDIIIKKRSHE